MTVTIDGHAIPRVAVVTIAGSDHRANALDFEDYDELTSACRELGARKDCRVVIVRGGQSAFSSGTDIVGFQESVPDFDGVAYEDRVHRAVSSLVALPQVTIAQVRGPATGGGLLLAVACDLRLGSQDARFGLPMARTLGNVLDPRSINLLVSSVGLATAQWLLLAAEVLDADRACSVGLVHQVVQDAGLEADVDALAGSCAQLAPLSVRATKSFLHATRQGSEPLVDGTQTVRDVYSSMDFREGIEAFTSRRRPVWAGK